MPAIILKSVGRNGVNSSGDVRVVQRLLNDYLAVDAKLLKVDGNAGPKTLAAIMEFQTEIGASVDGQVDPNGDTIRKLAEFHLKNAMSGTNPQIVALLKQVPLSKEEPAGLLLDSYWGLLRKI